MKHLLSSVLFLILLSCDNTQQTDNEKEKSETKIVINNGKEKDSINIQINSKDGIKIEGKDGKVEFKTDESGKISMEKKGKEVNIEIKEN